MQLIRTSDQSETTERNAQNLSLINVEHEWPTQFKSSSDNFVSRTLDKINHLYQNIQRYKKEG